MLHYSDLNHVAKELLRFLYVLILLQVFYTGRFVMFTNIYNDYRHLQQENQRIYLNGIVNSHRKTDFFFFCNQRCSMCAPRVTRHTSIRYSSSCHTHASTCLHRYSSLLQLSVPLGQRGHVAMVLCVLCTKCTLHSNHRVTRVIFQHTKRLLPRSGHFLTAYTRIA